MRLSGQVAQLVEQRTENPCVGGSIPPLATTETLTSFPRYTGVIDFYNAVLLGTTIMSFASSIALAISAPLTFGLFVCLTALFVLTVA